MKCFQFLFENLVCFIHVFTLLNLKYCCVHKLWLPILLFLYDKIFIFTILFSAHRQLNICFSKNSFFKSKLYWIEMKKREHFSVQSEENRMNKSYNQHFNFQSIKKIIAKWVIYFNCRSEIGRSNNSEIKKKNIKESIKAT